MKIAVLQRFLPSASRGGVGHFTHGLANALVGLGHQVTVFSRDPAPEGARYSVIQVAPLRPKTKWDFFWFPFDASRLDFSGFDLLHAQGDDQWISRRLPIVRTMHGSSWVEAFYNGIIRFSAKYFFMHLYFYFCEFIAHLRADVTVGVSKDTARYYWRIRSVIGNGIDVGLLERHPHEKSEKPSILFVGELHSRKCGDHLVEIFLKQVKPRLPKGELWLVSPEKAAGEGIRWFGKVEPQTLAQLYQQAWVFCLPSSYEGFGRPYVEALAAGTAVLATPNPGALEVLKNGKYGMIAPREKLGQALYDLLTQDALRTQFEKLGHVRAQDFSWDRIGKKYEEIYDQLIESHSRK